MSQPLGESLCGDIDPNPHNDISVSRGGVGYFGEDTANFFTVKVQVIDPLDEGTDACPCLNGFGGGKGGGGGDVAVGKICLLCAWLEHQREVKSATLGGVEVSPQSAFAVTLRVSYEQGRGGDPPLGYPTPSLKVGGVDGVINGYIPSLTLGERREQGLLAWQRNGHGVSPSVECCSFIISCLGDFLVNKV